MTARADKYKFLIQISLKFKQFYREMIEKLESAVNKWISEIKIDFKANKLYSDNITKNNLNFISD